MAVQREVKQELSFKEKGTFQSFYAAQKWLLENSFEHGSMDGGNPIAIQLDNYVLPQKWHNFDKEDEEMIDGIMTSNDWREGEVKVIIYK